LAVIEGAETLGNRWQSKMKGSWSKWGFSISKPSGVGVNFHAALSVFVKMKYR